LLRAPEVETRAPKLHSLHTMLVHVKKDDLDL
jgi:hypothetical protein